MRERVAEVMVRPRRFGRKLRVRVDLHGVSLFGPREEHTLIRWEWIKEIEVHGGVVVRSTNATIELPSGAFGLDDEALAARLREARSIGNRPEIIGELAQR